MREGDRYRDEYFDPTHNVRSLIEKTDKRQDDLRTAEGRRVDDLMKAESRRIDEVLDLRQAHAIELRDAEAKRIDAIRAVDVNAVSVASERAVAQATVLANQLASTAETARALVASTASSIAIQLVQIQGSFNDRVALIEKAQNEGRGSGTGIKDLFFYVFGVVMAIGSAVAIYAVLTHK